MDYTVVHSALSAQRSAMMHIHTILPILMLCYELLFLTSTPFDKLIEMNDGVRRSVSFKVVSNISNISEAVISINQIILLCRASTKSRLWW